MADPEIGYGKGAGGGKFEIFQKFSLRGQTKFFSKNVSFFNKNYFFFGGGGMAP